MTANSSNITWSGLILIIVLVGAAYTGIRFSFAVAEPAGESAVTTEPRAILFDSLSGEREQLAQLAAVVAESGQSARTPQEHTEMILRAIAGGADAAWTINPDNSAKIGRERNRYSTQGKSHSVVTDAVLPSLQKTAVADFELWAVDQKSYLGVRAPLAEGFVVLARRIPAELLARIEGMQAVIDGNRELRERRAKNQALWFVLLATFLGLLVCEASENSAVISRVIRSVQSELARRREAAEREEGAAESEAETSSNEENNSEQSHTEE